MHIPQSTLWHMILSNGIHAFKASTEALERKGPSFDLHRLSHTHTAHLAILFVRQKFVESRKSDENVDR